MLGWKNYSPQLLVLIESGRKTIEPNHEKRPRLVCVEVGLGDVILVFDSFGSFDEQQTVQENTQNVSLAFGSRQIEGKGLKDNSIMI